MDKNEFFIKLKEKQKELNSKQNILDKINYLKNINDKDYKQLKKDIEKQIILDDE